MEGIKYFSMPSFLRFCQMVASSKPLTEKIVKRYSLTEFDGIKKTERYMVRSKNFKYDFLAQRIDGIIEKLFAGKTDSKEISTCVGSILLNLHQDFTMIAVDFKDGRGFENFYIIYGKYLFDPLKIAERQEREGLETLFNHFKGSVVNKGLGSVKPSKYPSFKSFLEALNKMDWTGSTAYSLTYGNGVYQVQKQFTLDNIEVRTEFTGGHIGQRKHGSISHSLYVRYSYSDEKQGKYTSEVFTDPPQNDSERVVLRGLKWLYEKCFSNVHDIKLYGVFHKDFVSKKDFLPDTDKFLGFHFAANKETLEWILFNEGHDMRYWNIVEQPYDYGIFKWSFLDIFSDL